MVSTAYRENRLSVRRNQTALARRRRRRRTGNGRDVGPAHGIKRIFYCYRRNTNVRKMSSVRDSPAVRVDQIPENKAAFEKRPLSVPGPGRSALTEIRPNERPTVKTVVQLIFRCFWSITWAYLFCFEYTRRGKTSW